MGYEDVDEDWDDEIESKKASVEKKKIEWGSQIRSYVLDDRRVKDHRSGYQTGNTDAVLNGQIDEFLKANLMHKGDAAGGDD
mgnify:CR=1 FL=1